MMGIRDIARGIIGTFDRIFHFESAHAHCDIPCGIYDPYQAQVAAHTVLRMDMLIADVMKAAGDMNADFDRNKLIRCTNIKEQHAEMVKHEVCVIWGDYAKPEMATPELHALVWSIMKAASKAKQDTNIDSAKDLLAKVQQFSEWFWKTKNIPTKRVKSAYPTMEDIVMPQM